MDMEKELRRWQEKCMRLEQQVDGLKEENEGWREVQRVSDATVTALLRALGVKEEQEVCVGKSDIKDALEHFQVLAEEEEFKTGYRIRYMELK